jgi:hypothetical protein
MSHTVAGRGAGGLGGGGKGGGRYSSTAPQSGTGNTGGGGGGGGWRHTHYGGSGGSGIIILKYFSFATAIFSAGVTSTTRIVGNYKVTEITAAGPNDTITFG